MKILLAVVVAGTCAVLPAMADAATWNGEGSLSAGINTGNTETSDLGAGLKFTRQSQVWRTGLEFHADYGTKNGSRTKNRFFASGQADRTINDRLFGFGRLSHEEDEFSGFNS